MTTNLRALQKLIQAVVPWENYHLYEFAIGDRVYGELSPDDAEWGRVPTRSQFGKFDEPKRQLPR